DPGLFELAGGEVVVGVAGQLGDGQEALMFEVAYPYLAGVRGAVGHLDTLAVPLFQVAAVVALGQAVGEGAELDLAPVAGALQRGMVEVGQFVGRYQPFVLGQFALHPFHAELPRLVGRHVAAFFGDGVANGGQAAMRGVVVFFDREVDEGDEVVPFDEERAGVALLDGLAGFLVDDAGGVVVHVAADVGAELFGGFDEDGLVPALGEAVGLRVARAAVFGRDAEAVHDAGAGGGHHLVFVAAAVVGVEDGR